MSKSPGSGARKTDYFPRFTQRPLGGGCWFCPKQPVDQLRLVRANYPELWKIMLAWDADSIVPFHADGHTVHDFDERFALEDQGIVSAGEPWKWSYLYEVQLKWR